MKREQEIIEAGIEYTIANKPRCIAGDNFSDLARQFNKNKDFEAGAIWADSHPHWISVVDELPTEEGWILICSYSDVDMWYYNGQTAKDLMDYASITHWMPLPQPPKKGD